VPESGSAKRRFPGERLASFLCGFGEAKTDIYRVIGTKGELVMEPGYTWHGDIRQTVTAGEDTKSKTFKKRDQVAPEILYFSDCILTGKEPEPSGEEGLTDVLIIEALRTSYTKGEFIRLEGLPARPHPDPQQEIERPANAEPELVNAASPGGK